jgi:flagellar biosynthetic protein FlhB
VGEDKTEPATWKKRKKARDEGQVARSQELVAALVLLGVVYTIPTFGPGAVRAASDFFVQAFSSAGKGRMNAESLGALAGNGLWHVVLLAFPLLAMVGVIGLATNVAQVGLIFSPLALRPKPEKLNPLQGIKRLFQPQSLVELLKGAVKITIVVYSGWTFLSAHQNVIVGLAESDPSTIAPRVGVMAFEMVKQMAATLAIVAALDYAYQRYQFEKNLRMTKQEVKDEMRDAEGNPEIKGRIRRKMREISRKRMMADVKTASVVITNPTHFAVALKYETGKGGAPKVVAKGADLVALKIRELAAENNVPLVENPPLARSLFKLTEVGDEIPQSLYKAVAEVLAMIWRLDARRRGARR